MLEKVTLKKGEDKSQFFEIWEPRVFFQIPSDLHQEQYLRWMNEFVSQFMLILSPSAKNESASYRAVAGKLQTQGGIQSCYIGDVYFPGCKAYIYDDTYAVADTVKKKGLLMRDHEELISMTVHIYNMAEAFELYLREKGITFQRIGRKTEKFSHQEFEQVTE